jgi:hypothetical protein
MAYVEGLREAVKQLEELGADVDDLKDTMAEIAAEAVEVMQPLIPTRSGKLRASARGNRAKGKAVVTIGRATVRYAAPINYGWPKRNIRPANFTSKTDKAMETRAPELLEQGINAAIEKRGLA